MTDFVAQKRKDYDRKDPKCITFKQKLTFLAGTTSLAYNVIQSEEFGALIHVLDERIPVPTACTVSKWVKEMAEELNAKVAAFVQDANRFSVCLDLWSQKGLTYSYLGVTVHFYSPKMKELASAAVACKSLPHPHTEKAISEALAQVFVDWGFERENVVRYVTDQGANIMASLRNYQIVQMEAPDFEPRGCNMQGMEDSDVESESEADFERDQQELQRIFPQRCSCFAHMLSTTCHKVLDARDSPIEQLKGQVLPLVLKFSHSGSATEGLKRIAGKKLLKVAKTCWNSFYYVCNRLVELCAEVIQVCQERDWPIVFQWAELELCRDLLKPFADMTTLLEGQKYPTSPGVIPALLTLKEHLQVKLPT